MIYQFTTDDGFTFDADRFETPGLFLASMKRFTSVPFKRGAKGATNFFDFCAVAVESWPFDLDPSSRDGYGELREDEVMRLMNAVTAWLQSGETTGQGQPNRKERRRLDKLRRKGKK